MPWLFVSAMHWMWRTCNHCNPARARYGRQGTGSRKGEIMELQNVNKDSRQTYTGFLTVTKWATVLIAIVLALMAWFLV